MPEFNEQADNEMQELDNLFDEANSEVSPTSQNGDTSPEPNKVEETKRVSERIKTVKAETELETRDNVAKELGYESYKDMLEKRNRKELEEKGYDPNDVEPLIQQKAQELLKSDPSYKLLRELEEQKLINKANAELLEIQKFNPSIKTLDDLSDSVFELAKTTGSLKRAYLALEGDKLIIAQKSKQSAGNTSHLITPSGNPGADNTVRPLTKEERAIYKKFNPEMTDEQLNKITKKI